MIFKNWINRTFGSTGALTGADIPYDGTKSLTEKINEAGGGAPQYSVPNDPLVTYDLAGGYLVGQKLLNTVENSVYECIKNTNGAPIWAMITAPKTVSFLYIGGSVASINGIKDWPLTNTEGSTELIVNPLSANHFTLGAGAYLVNSTSVGRATGDSTNLLTDNSNNILVYSQKINLSSSSAVSGAITMVNRSLEIDGSTSMKIRNISTVADGQGMALAAADQPGMQLSFTKIGAKDVY